ncbi:MAG: hypothetical protein H6553_02425 [Chitinophagales bacterium]|nr:hypothetical protein [Chitinophagales bacterium]
MKKLQQLTERTFRFFETRIAGTVYCYLLSLQEQVTKRGQLYCVVILSVAKKLSSTEHCASNEAISSSHIILGGTQYTKSQY